MKRFVKYLNPFYDLKVMTVFKTESDMPHFKRARAGFIAALSLVSALFQIALHFWR